MKYNLDDLHKLIAALSIENWKLKSDIEEKNKIIIELQSLAKTLTINAMSNESETRP